MIPGCSFAGYYAAYSPHNQEESPHFLRQKQPLFTAPVPSLVNGFIVPLKEIFKSAFGQSICGLNLDILLP